MAIFAVLLILALLWLALLYLGIPLGIIGVGIGAYLFKTNSENADDIDAVKAKTNRRDAVIIAGASAALIVASLVGNYFDKDGPLHSWMNSDHEPAIDQIGEP